MNIILRDFFFLAGGVLYHLRQLVMPTRAFCTRAYDTFPPQFMMDAIAELDQNKYRPNYWHRFTQGGIYDERDWTTPLLTDASVRAGDDVGRGGGSPVKDSILP